jgi:hypothetical protein
MAKFDQVTVVAVNGGDDGTNVIDSIRRTTAALPGSRGLLIAALPARKSVRLQKRHILFRYEASHNQAERAGLQRTSPLRSMGCFRRHQRSQSGRRICAGQAHRAVGRSPCLGSGALRGARRAPVCAGHDSRWCHAHRGCDRPTSSSANSARSNFAIERQTAVSVNYRFTLNFNSHSVIRS